MTPQTRKEAIEVLRFIVVMLAFGLASLLVLVVWTGDIFEEYDPYTINVEYDCREVIDDPVGFPEQVIEECFKLLKPLKTKQVTAVI